MVRPIACWVHRPAASGRRRRAEWPPEHRTRKKPLSDPRRIASALSYWLRRSSPPLWRSFDGTIVTIALPAIQSEVAADLQSLKWVLNGYTLMLGALVLVGGSLGDRLGRRRLFAGGGARYSLSLRCSGRWRRVSRFSSLAACCSGRAPARWSRRAWRSSPPLFRAMRAGGLSELGLPHRRSPLHLDRRLAVLRSMLGPGEQLSGSISSSRRRRFRPSPSAGLRVHAPTRLSTRSGPGRSVSLRAGARRPGPRLPLVRRRRPWRPSG